MKWNIFHKKMVFMQLKNLSHLHDYVLKVFCYMIWLFCTKIFKNQITKKMQNPMLRNRFRIQVQIKTHTRTMSKFLYTHFLNWPFVIRIVYLCTVKSSGSGSLFWIPIVQFMTKKKNTIRNKRNKNCTEQMFARFRTSMHRCVRFLW